MSILIKGMEMPKTCASCEWSRYSFPNAWCSITHSIHDMDIATKGRPSDCPLHEVTDTDTDEIYHIVRNAYNDANHDYLQKQISICAEYLTEEQKQKIREQGMFVI